MRPRPGCCATFTSETFTLLRRTERVPGIIGVEGANQRQRVLGPRRMNTMTTKSGSRSWRRYQRISVRVLIVLVLAIGTGQGWMVHSAQIQRKASGAVTSAGGSVLYDWQWDKGKENLRAKPRAPRWLTHFIGVDYFGHVTVVDLTDSATNADAMITKVVPLALLQRLIITGAPVSDTGLAHLKGLTSLFEIHIDGTRVTDAGLAHLKGLTQLSKLVIYYDVYPRITDAGMRELEQAVPNLRIYRSPLVPER